MQAHNKRLTLLSEEEEDALYSLPELDETQQQEYFTLSDEEQKLMLSRSGLSAQIYCALQIGYFKAKQTFFDFKWKEVPQGDIDFLMKNYFPKQHFLAQPITKYEYYTQVNKIAYLYGYKLWSKEFAEELRLYVTSTSRKDMNLGFILAELLKFLEKKKIVRPGYTTLQDIVSKALNDEHLRLYNILKSKIDDTSKKIIEKLLERDDIISYLAVLKQEAKKL